MTTRLTMALAVMIVAGVMLVLFLQSEPPVHQQPPTVVTDAQGLR
jgi:hypothetical protein